MMRLSARKRSCESRSWRRDSKLLYLAFSLLMPITRVIRLPSSKGKEGWLTTSLNVRCGSGTMRHIDVSGVVLRECGRGIFPGLRRAWCVMWCFVVRISHIGSISAGNGDKEVEVARRFFLVEAEAASVALLWMWVRRAVEALRICGLLGWAYLLQEEQSYLRLI